MPPRAKKTDNTPEDKEIKKPAKRGRKPAAKKQGRPPVPKPLPKKLPVKQVAKEEKNENKADAPAKADKEPRGKKEKSGKGGKIVPIIATFIVTAAIVGVPLYIWLQQSGQDEIVEVQQSARETRISFEQRLQQAMDKLTGVESENEELKKKQEELAKQAELLKGAKKEFYSPELGVSFEYPAIFGNVTIEFEQAATGTMFIGTFSNTDSLKFSGISDDFASSTSPVSASSTIALVENWGFNDIGGDYYYFPVADLDERFYITPVKVLDLGGAEALLVNSSSFEPDLSEDETRTLPMVEMDASLAALINLDNESYPGLTFYDRNLEELPQEDFITIVESILVE